LFYRYGILSILTTMMVLYFTFSGTKDDYSDEFALHRAVRKAKFDVVRSLVVEKGADVNKEDEKGITPFIEAILSGNLPTIVLMMRMGARVQPNPGFRHTPLRAACLTGNIPAVTMLLEAGADPNAKSEGDRTPLMGACFLRPNIDASLSLPAVRIMLQDSRTNPLIANSFNETALDLCKQRKYTDSINILNDAVKASKNISLPLFQ